MFLKVLPSKGLSLKDFSSQVYSSKVLQNLLLFGISLWLMVACRGDISTSETRLPLQIAYANWPGFYPLVIAQEKGFFAQQGLEVEVFLGTATQILTNFTAGQYDGMLATLGDAVNATATTTQPQVVAMVDESAGADAIVAQAEIKQVADLQGQRIGVALGMFGEVFVNEMLRMHQLTTNDVVLVKTEAEKVVEQLEAGHIQAGHTWEPYSSAGKAIGAHVIFSTRSTPGLISDVIVFSESVLNDRPQDVQAFIQAWFQAADYWKAHFDEGNAIIAQALQLDPATISLDGLKLSSLTDNQQAFTPSNTTRSLHYTTKLYSDFYIQKGVLTNPVTGDRLLNDSFIQPN